MQDSPTLDLAKDCSRFVARHFEIISTSSPHIYHSVLALTPRESIVRKLYESHARPSVRVVHGVPALWDSNTAAITPPFAIGVAAWSPCNRFIAISSRDATRVDILDSPTLQRFQNLEFSQKISPPPEALTFSPDSRTLTSFIREHCSPYTTVLVVSWDLQTGGVVSTIEWKGTLDTKVERAQITYSMNGRMVAVLSRYKFSTAISIYDIESGRYTHDIDYRTHTNLYLGSGTQHVVKIWVHEESLRFATHGPLAITIWEVGFAPGVTPTKVEIIPILDNTIRSFVFKPREQSDIVWTKFHPASCRLAFIPTGTAGTLMVWDARTSKYLLHHKGITFYPSMTFSSDGHFFACATITPEVYLWEESPTGYTLIEKLMASTPLSELCFSPSGQSIIAFNGPTIQLWHTTISTTSDIVQPLQHTGEDFVLEFLPDRSLAATARKGDKTVTVLNLKSSILELTIDASIEVYGLRLIENTIIIVGSEKTITWNLPGGSFLSDARMNIEDSTCTTNFCNIDNGTVAAASISHDLLYIALARYEEEGDFVDVYHTSTGKHLRVKVWASALWFAPGVDDIWCAADSEAEVFTIDCDTVNQTNTAVDIEDGLWGCPWGSSHGYKVTDEGWVLGAGGKRLIMLPPLWQSDGVGRVWSERYLALLHGGLPEIVILELEP